MSNKVQKEIDRLVQLLVNDQGQDGSWNYPFETGIITDCYMIILLRSLEIDDEELIYKLAQRIRKQQKQNGTWTLFYDEGAGNLTTTIEAYYALLYSGYVDPQEPLMKQAQLFITKNGNLAKAGMFTKIMLAITGQTEWDFHFPVPIEFVLLPTKFPINFYDISIFGRSNIAPILILANYQYSITTNKSPDLKEIFNYRETNNKFLDYHYSEGSRTILDFVKEGIESVIDLHDEVHEKALMKLENYIVNRVELDGTFYSYFSATFLMIFALLARGKDKKDPIIRNAVTGLKSMICEIDGLPHCQYTTANVWNTALISDVLQHAGVSNSHTVVQKASQYLVSRQHFKYGDWAIHNKNTLPGGWGFSNINTINPDVDDTTATLRAIRSLTVKDSRYRSLWDRGVQWVLSMQNDDGGWPAFEREIDNSLLAWLPGGEDLLLDASSTDLTGRTLEFLGEYTTLNHEHNQIKKAVKWLLKNQEDDGSWISRWGICYIYGTWTALIGLNAVRVSNRHPAVIRGAEWLLSIQNKDGGWGESCKSDISKHYVPLKFSTLTHTAWALDALITITDYPTEAINKGINFLLENADNIDWRTQYPKGQGAGGIFYIHYHSYDYIWPLLTLSKYNKKYENKSINLQNLTIKQ